MQWWVQKRGSRAEPPVPIVAPMMPCTELWGVPSTCGRKVKKFVSAKIGSSVAVVVAVKPATLVRSRPRNSGLAESRNAGWTSGFWFQFQ